MKKATFSPLSRMTLIGRKKNGFDIGNRTGMESA